MCQPSSVISRDFHGSEWPRAVIFDCDGLLIDSSPAWLTAYEEVLERCGRALADEDFTALLGASVSGAAERLGVPELALRKALTKSFAAQSPETLEGAEHLVRSLEGRAKLGVATNGPRELIRRALLAAQLLDPFDAVVSAESVARAKPAPDVYVAACRALDVHPSDAIALEDSAVGVASARAAGIMVVYVPSSSAALTDADLRVARLDDLALLRLLGIDDGGPIGQAR